MGVPEAGNCRMLDLLMEEKAGIMVRSDLRKNFPSDDRAAEPRSYSGLIPPSCQFPVISRGSSQGTDHRGLPALSLS